MLIFVNINLMILERVSRKEIIMQIDFHFSMIYVLARAAGFEKEIADKIAWASQFVDDNMIESHSIIENGIKSEIMPTSHKVVDQSIIVFENGINIWVPFHFLPAGLNNTFAEKLVCQKATENENVIRIIEVYQKEDFDPIYLGIISHVIADTYSHQNFNGMLSNQNDIDNVQPELLDDKPKAKKIRKKIWRFVKNLIEKGVSHIFRVGHAEADDRPDIPYLTWSYTRKGTRVDVNNIKRVEEAIGYIYQLFIEEAKRNYCTKSPQHSEEILAQIMKIVRNNRIENLEKRQNIWLSKINRNEFDFIEESDVVYKDSNVSEIDLKLFYKAVESHKDYVVNCLLPIIFGT